MKYTLLSFVLLLVTQCIYGQPEWKHIPPATNASFRGLSVADDNVAWVSGSKGWVGTSIDGGNNWNFKQVKGYEQCDFRSLYAFSASTAIIANAGTPACILRTTDSGRSWTEVYRKADTNAFIDGIDFWNGQEGMIYGDPLGGRMMILYTKDGGKNWLELVGPVLEKDEASFAASGTNIHCMAKGKVMIATGGKVSRLLVSANKGNSWQTMNTPILQGQNSTGIFSFAFADVLHGIIAGGDYKQDTLKKDHVFYTTNAGKTWIAPATPTGGYRECVTYINADTVIATGPGGTDVSFNGGKNWKLLLDEKGYHVARKSPKGKAIIFAGANGKISLLTL